MRKNKLYIILLLQKSNYVMYVQKKYEEFIPEYISVIIPGGVLSDRTFCHDGNVLYLYYIYAGM